MDADERLGLIEKDLAEVVTDEELRGCLSEGRELLGYIGFEPSGRMHIGQVINVLKVIDMTRAGVKFLIFLADWHAKINDKFGGDIEKIRICGEYIRHCFLALGVDPERTEFLYASDIVDRSEYWEKVLQISKASSLSRIRRAMTIMGREEEDAELDFSKLIYPPMQVADIFALGVDIAYGGLDQRHAHMLARDAAEKLGWKKPVALHSKLIPSLSGGGRMDTAQKKMSKSDPRSSVVVDDPPEVIEEKISMAYCPQNEVQENPVLAIAELLILPAKGTFELDRSDKFGGDLRFEEYAELESAYASGKIHPKDLKENTARELAEMLEPVRKYFERNPEPMRNMKNLLLGEK